MATKKYQITQLQNDDSLLVLHPETDADIVSVTTGSGAYGGQATNVQDALEEVYTLAQTGGVTGVKGDSESSYRTGDVNITKANIGLGNVNNLQNDYAIYNYVSDIGLTAAATLANIWNAMPDNSIMITSEGSIATASRPLSGAATYVIARYGSNRGFIECYGYNATRYFMAISGGAPSGTWKTYTLT